MNVHLSEIGAELALHDITGGEELVRILCDALLQCFIGRVGLNGGLCCDLCGGCGRMVRRLIKLVAQKIVLQWKMTLTMNNNRIEKA